MKRLVLLVVLAWSCCRAVGETKYALVIGIAGYPHFNTNLKLKYAGADAEKFATFIQTPEGGGFPAANVHLVTNEKATRDRIYDEFTWLESHVGADDVVYVYFAGHGDKYKDKSYFMPYDAAPSRPDDRGIAMDDFYKKVTTELQARQVVVFVDACHAAGADSGAKGAADGENGKNAWDSLNRKAGQVTMGFFSSASNEDSYEDDEFKQGLFTHYLLDGLRGAAKSTPDGFINSQNLYDFVEEAVAVRSRAKFPDQQTPQKSHEFAANYRLAKVRTTIVTAGDEKAHYATGNAMALNGNWTEAIAQFNEAIRINPNYAQAHDYLGVALSWKDDWQGAVNEYSRAKALNPNIVGIDGRLAQAHYSYGLSFAAKKNWDAAIAEYKLALAVNPSYAEAHQSMGTALSWKGDYKGAVNEYTTALGMKPDLPGGKDKLAVAYNGYGVDLAGQKNWDDAITQYKQALQLKPDYPEAHYSLGAALTWKKQYDDAIAELKLSLQLKPDYAEAYQAWGANLTWKDDWQGAADKYKQSLKLKPDNPQLHNSLGLVLEHLGDKAGALEEYRTALAALPNDTAIRANYDRLKGASQ
jgi:tetratricopeptide (TPR) repeat protein